MACLCSPSLAALPPSGREYETLKRLEDRTIAGLQPADLLDLTRKAAEQGLIDARVKANIENMDSSVPHPLVCRYLFYSVYGRIFGKFGKMQKVEYGYEQWLNMLSRSNSAVRFLIGNSEQSTDFYEQDISWLSDILAGCSSNWREIGISLGLPRNEIKTIARIYGTKPNYCLNAILISWVMSKFPYTKPPRLESLEEALGSQMVGFVKEARIQRDKVLEKIASKMCPYLEQLNSSTEAHEIGSEVFQILDQTSIAKADEGKSMLVEVRVRSPPNEKPFCKWHPDSSSYQTVECSFPLSSQGVHVFMVCFSECDLTTEGAYTCEVSLQKGKTKESKPILLSVSTPIDAYCKCLIDIYTDQPPVPEDTWSPVVENTCTSLALIKQESILCAGKYGHTIRGDMDDIYENKESTDFVKAFHSLGSGMRMLVEGRPGSGKTTLVHKVSQDWANGCLKMNCVRLVFLVHLRALSAIPKIDLSTILNCFHYGDSAKCDIIKYAEKHRGLGLCFILDGLDEYSPNSGEDYIFKLIKKENLPNALIIFASRPAAASRFRSIATIQVEVLGFLKEQIRDYINNYKFLTDSQCSDLHKYINQHPNVHHICYLPIHIAMVCFLFEIEAELPNTETGIYKEFAGALILRILSRFEDDPCLPSLEDLPSPQRDTYMNICKLAYEMTVSSKQVMQETEVHSSVNVKSEADLLGLVTVDRLAMRCGFQKMYTFLHLTFQEFLGAYYVSHLPEVEQMELLEKHGQAEHMRQVWKFYCGLTKLELGKVFGVLFAESSLHSRVFMIQCIFESQSQHLCDFAVRNETLALSQSYLNHSDFTAAAYVISNATVQELSFDGCVFGKEEVATLIEKGGNNVSQILALTFFDNNIAAEQIEVANTLAHFLPSLELFDLSHTNISESMVLALAKNLSHPTLQVLKVGSRGNDLYSSLELPLDLAHTFKAKCKNFRNICFSGNNGVCLPADAQWPLPFCFCCNHPNLVLSCHPLCAVEVRALSHDLKAHIYSHLCLINCDIGDQAMFYLAQGLNYCSGLETLELTCNRVGDSGAVYLANSIKSCLKLSKLDLSCNRIGNKGAVAVANSVSSNVKVYFCLNCITNQISGMGYNNFDTIALSSKGLLDSDISSLAATLLSLNNCDELLQLYLQGNCISCTGMLPLSRVLSNCSNLLVLNLSSNKIEGKGAVILAGALAHCTNLLKLDVSSNNLGSDGAKAIAEVLTGCTEMLELNISLNSIGCDGTEAIAQALHHCPALQELDISFNNLGVKGAKFLADAIQCCKCILSLDASANDIGDEGAVVLAKGLKCCWSLQVLKIKCNYIKSKGAKAISKALEHCPFILALDVGYNSIELKDIVSQYHNLQEFDFCYNIYKVADCKAWYSKTFQNLTVFNISNIKLDSGGARSLARGMSGSLNIHEFCICENCICDDGAQAIADILSKCDSLQLLDVAQNSITDVGTTALASALRGKAARMLDFSRNYIGSCGASALAVILDSVAIRRLKIEGCGVGPKGAKFLAQSLKYCSNLLELNISGNNIESSGAIAIAGCLSQCRNLQVLHLSERQCLAMHCIGQDGCQALAAALCECNNLNVLDISWTDILGDVFFKNCVQIDVSGCRYIKCFHSDAQLCINLEKIDVSHISFSKEMVADFCFLLRNCRLLKELSIGHNHVNLDSAKTLSDSLYYCVKLEVLDVSFTFEGYSNTTGELTRCLCSKFVHNVNLRSLSIEGNLLGVAGVITLVDCLKYCTKLQELSIGANEIKDEGTIALAGALKYWSDLRVLRVGCKFKYDRYSYASNDIGVDGFSCLSRALENCPHLYELDVSGNEISPESIDRLLSSLQANSGEFTQYQGLYGAFGFKRITY